MIANDIIISAAAAVNDAGRETWSQTQWLEFVNLAVLATLEARPELAATAAAVTLAAGVRQSIPANGFRFLSCPTLPGFSMARLREVNPAYAAAPATATPKGVGFDPVTPREFYVQPPNVGGGALTIIYAALPPTIADVGATVPLPDAYAPALIEHVLYQVQRTVYGGEADRAVAHFQQWARLVAGARAEA